METQPRPNPDDLLAEAVQVPANEKLHPYTRTIVTLRGKALSWRAIAAWLSERGVETTHTSVRKHYMAQVGSSNEADSGGSDPARDTLNLIGWDDA